MVSVALPIVNSILEDLVSQIPEISDTTQFCRGLILGELIPSVIPELHDRLDSVSSFSSFSSSSEDESVDNITNQMNSILAPDVDTPLARIAQGDFSFPYLVESCFEVFSSRLASVWHVLGGTVCPDWIRRADLRPFGRGLPTTSSQPQVDRGNGRLDSLQSL